MTDAEGPCAENGGPRPVCIRGVRLVYTGRDARFTLAAARSYLSPETHRSRRMPSHANPVNWFEIPVTDMARAKSFYETVLEIEITEAEMGPNKMGWFPMEMGRMGSPGSLVLGEGYRPSRDGSLVYINVDAIDPTLEAVNKQGGTTLMSRTDIGQHGFIAHFEDSEGNRVALHEAPSR